MAINLSKQMDGTGRLERRALNLNGGRHYCLLYIAMFVEMNTNSLTKKTDVIKHLRKDKKEKNIRFLKMYNSPL